MSRRDLTERPYVQQAIQTQILYDLASMMEELLRLTKLQIPIGEVLSFKLEVGDKDVILENVAHYSFPWMGFTLINDGPSPVYFVINQRGVPSTSLRCPIEAGDQIDVDLGARVINILSLRCNPGQSTTVRIYAKRSINLKAVILASCFLSSWFVANHSSLDRTVIVIWSCSDSSSSIHFIRKSPVPHAVSNVRS